MVLIGSLRGVKTATQLPTQFVPWKGRGRLGLMVYEATVPKKKKNLGEWWGGGQEGLHEHQTPGYLGTEERS